MSNKPLSVNLALGKAKTLARKGAPAQAARLYRAVLEKFPGNKRAIEGLKALAGSMPGRQRIALDTGGIQEQIDALIALCESGRPSEALARATALAGRYPDDPQILNFLGAVNALTGRLDEAAADLTKALQIRPDYAEAHGSLGNVLSELGQPEQAISSYTEALRIKPDYAEAHNNLGNVLNGLGKHQQAVACYSRALKLIPDYADAYYNLANALTELGQFERAIACYAKALQLVPGFAEAHNSLANALNKSGQPKQALASYAKALQIKPDYAEAHNNLGNLLSDLDQQEQAIASYTEALRIKPGYVEAHCNLAAALSDLGKHEQAIASYTEALRIKPDYAKAYENLGRIKTYRPGDPQIARMRQTIANRAIPEADRILLGFALGKACDDVGDVENSFRHFLEANRLRKKQLGYDSATDKRLFNRIKSIFSAGELPSIEEIRPGAGGDRQPVFIVGMHRSGTTLAEQILASHSQIYGADEIGFLESIVTPTVTDVDYGRLTLDTVKHIRHDYLSELNLLGDGQPCITDKMPLNFRWIGFILTAMPEAKIVNLQRDPAANCWSIFKQYFASREIEYVYDLVDIAEYYNLYIDLMEFWRAKFPNRIYDLSYESLTENQEAETRKLLEYCNLGWEDRCLEFHKTKRAVRTPSSVQVRQAMYQGSSAAWRKYETQLQPMIQALEQVPLR